MCAAVNFDFILILINFDFIFCNSDVNFVLYYKLLLYFVQLEMHVRLICAIKFYFYLLTDDAYSAAGGILDAVYCVPQPAIGQRAWHRGP